MEITVFAPVIIPTLNRCNHLKRCVESLAQCTHADKTELIIGVDYPPSEKYVEGWHQVCDYVKTIKGFAKVTLFYQNENLGPGPNSELLKKYARKHHSCFVWTEDDNEFSPNFLDYMNKALMAYEDNPKVYAVCGYNYAQVDMSGYEKEYYMSHEMSAWGWGSWFNEKYDNIQKTVRKPGYLLKLVKEIPFKTFIKDGTKRCNLVYEIGRGFTGDGYYTYYEWNNDTYCVFPTISLSRNFGHDGSGLHCVDDEEIYAFASQEIDQRAIFESDFDLPAQMDPEIERIFKNFQRGSFKSKAKKVILLFLIKLFVLIRKY